mmetsp:Transcript_458/g.1016  ORF Transcript_458/g.1016 Transcript_458/m.1016 type:complete len:203 (+) Transcript_458:368-976(+)
MAHCRRSRNARLPPCLTAFDTKHNARALKPNHSAELHSRGPAGEDTAGRQPQGPTEGIDRARTKRNKTHDAMLWEERDGTSSCPSSPPFPLTPQLSPPPQLISSARLSLHSLPVGPGRLSSPPFPSTHPPTLPKVPPHACHLDPLSLPPFNQHLPAPPTCGSIASRTSPSSSPISFGVCSLPTASPSNINRTASMFCPRRVQ